MELPNIRRRTLLKAGIATIGLGWAVSIFSDNISLASEKSSIKPGSSYPYVIEIFDGRQDDWKHTYEKEEIKGSDARSVYREDSDVIAAGSSWITKIDKTGQEYWSKIFDETVIVSSITPTNDGPTVLFVEQISDPTAIDNDFRVIIANINKSGSIENPKVVYNTQDDMQYTDYQTTNVNSFHLATEDNGYLLIGSTSIFSVSQGSPNKIWIIKTDSDFEEIWRYETEFEQMKNMTYSIDEVSKDGYILISNNRQQHPLTNSELIKIDNAGEEEWKKVIGSDLGSIHIQSVVSGTDGGFLLVGQLTDETLFPSGFLIKTNSVGDVIWEKRIQKAKNRINFHSACSDQEEYLLLGSTHTDKEWKHWIMRINNTGDEKETYMFDSNYVFNSVSSTEEGSYLLAGRRSF